MYSETFKSNIILGNVHKSSSDKLQITSLTLQVLPH